METVGVVISVGHSGDHAETRLVHLYEAAGQALRRGGEKREVEIALLALLVAAGAHMADDIEAEVLRTFILAVVRADEALERLGKADETDGQRAVLEHFTYFVVPGKLVAVDPDALAHEDRVVVDVLAALDLETL